MVNKRQLKFWGKVVQKALMYGSGVVSCLYSLGFITLVSSYVLLPIAISMLMVSMSLEFNNNDVTELKENLTKFINEHQNNMTEEQRRNIDEISTITRNFNIAPTQTHDPTETGTVYNQPIYSGNIISNEIEQV